MKTSEVIRSARESILDKSKFGKGDVPRPGTSCCVEAIVAAAHLPANAIAQPPAMVIVCLNYLRSVMKKSVAEYNDTHTHAEVLAAMERAAKLAETEND